MNWITRFLLGHWSSILGGFLLLLALIFGIQIGQSRVQRAWDAEKLNAALTQAKQEQHVADTLHAQKTINQEILNEFQTKKGMLAGLRPALRGGDVGLRIQPSHDSVIMPAFSSIATGVAATPADAVPNSTGSTASIQCEQLARDAAETTLMVLELQKWYSKQAAAANTDEP